MNVRMKDGAVEVTMNRDEASAVRACLYRDGRYPQSPAVQILRSELWDLLADDCPYCGHEEPAHKRARAQGVQPHE